MNIIRILRVWYYGKLSLAKKMRKRVFIERLYSNILNYKERYDYITSEEYQYNFDKAQSEYFNELVK